MALGASLAESNPLKATAFREEDIRWARMSEISLLFLDFQFILLRSPIFSFVRMKIMGIKPEDRALIQSLLLSISELNVFSSI